MASSLAEQVSGLVEKIKNSFKKIKPFGDIHGDEDFLKAFREVFGKIPLVSETLEAIQPQMSSLEADFCEEMKQGMQDCKEKAEGLEKIFERVIPEDSIPRLGRYIDVAGSLGKGNNSVEALMTGIIRHLLSFMDNQTIQQVAPGAVEKLEKAMKDLAAMPPSLPKAPTAQGGILNYGAGPQNVHTGSGPQNNNNGPGNQFMGDFQAPFHFGPSNAEASGSSK